MAKDDTDACVILELAVQGYSFRARLHRKEFRNLNQAGRERQDRREKQARLQKQLMALVQALFPELCLPRESPVGASTLANPKGHLDRRDALRPIYQAG